MSALTLLGVALGLAMDAFAVAVGAGLQLCDVSKRQTFRMAWHFGLFQALMPVIGWLAGLTLVEFIEPVDHWIAFGLLAFIGGKMVYEALRHSDEPADRCDPTRGWRLVTLSVATSIDALAVGLSMAVLGLSIWWPALVIGVVASAMTVIGLELGCRFGSLLGRRMEIVGGLILIGIGVKILVEHLTG
ncbi:MAG: manganese efflux pump [Actinobacteria bacterium]|nr:manganese efflux pump [Actinomycetota bacterium]